MATPNADRLHGIEDWRTSAIEDSFRLFSSVKSSLTEIAAINREVASDLGLEGGTANAACKILDGIATGLYEDADNLQKIIDVSKDALAGGVQAKHESEEIQADLTAINNAYIGKMAQRGNNAGPQNTPEIVAQLEAQRDAAHAEIEKRATKTLSTLNGRTLTAIGGLPFQDQIRAILGKDNPEFVERLTQHMDFRRQVEPGNASPRAGSAPTRSATDWRASPDLSVGSPGSHTGHVPTTSGGGSAGGVSLQGSHYSPTPSGVFVPGSPTPHAAPIGGTGAHHDPLAIGGGAVLGGVAGFRAYQAARAARAAEAPGSRAGALRSGAALRTTPSSSGSILRGATTAARTPASSSSASRGIVRGGATGVARPTSPSGGRGILRGATTAARTPTSSASTSRGIVRGATTAVRKTTGSSSPVGKSGSARTESTASRTAGTSSRSASPTRATRPDAKTGNSRGAGASKAGIGRGAGANGKATPARGTKTAGSTARSGASTARAGSRGTGASSLTARSQTGKAPQAQSGSPSRAMSSLTGRPARNADKKKRNRDQTGTDVTAYETDKTVTFLEAGRRTTNNEDNAR